MRWTAAGIREADWQIPLVVGYRDLAKVAVALEEGGRTAIGTAQERPSRSDQSDHDRCRSSTVIGTSSNQPPDSAPTDLTRRSA